MYDETQAAEVSEHRAFQMISEIHSLLDQIERRSAILLAPQSAKLDPGSGGLSTRIPSQLEDRLGGLINHAKDLLARY